ncbi:MAG: hypothetical protein J7L69_07705 [Desulfobulbaceae bacterium]|nr:hypothetical protein [Desulfobulbaceae bacterium]
MRHIAIDEVYLGKKRKFITLVLDLRTERVLPIHSKLVLLQPCAIVVI